MRMGPLLLLRSTAPCKIEDIGEHVAKQNIRRRWWQQQVNEQRVRVGTLPAAAQRSTLREIEHVAEQNVTMRFLPDGLVLNWMRNMGPCCCCAAQLPAAK
jgi:hypothetical protein